MVAGNRHLRGRTLDEGLAGGAHLDGRAHDTRAQGLGEDQPVADAASAVAQDPAGMAAVFQGARVAVSPSTHDGTPNTLLEAMSCGSFPVAGDIESLREWIEPGSANTSRPCSAARRSVAPMYRLTMSLIPDDVVLKSSMPENNLNNFQRVSGLTRDRHYRVKFKVNGIIV